jgi:hypothetical protein
MRSLPFGTDDPHCANQSSHGASRLPERARGNKKAPAVDIPRALANDREMQTETNKTITPLRHNGRGRSGDSARIRVVARFDRAHNGPVDDYWRLDVELASEDEAEQAIEILKEALPAGHRVLYAVDPAHVLTWHLDAPSVETIRAALAGHSQNGADVGGLLATCDEWLSAHPGDNW